MYQIVINTDYIYTRPKLVLLINCLVKVVNICPYSTLYMYPFSIFYILRKEKGRDHGVVINMLDYCVSLLAHSLGLIPSAGK